MKLPQRIRIRLGRYAAFALIFAACVALFYFSGIGCAFEYVIGLSCAGCGLTRAWIYAFSLDFTAALHYHPLFWLVAPATLAALWLDTSESLRVKRILRVFLALCAAAFIITYFIRLAGPSDVVGFDFKRSLIYRILLFFSRFF